MCHTSVQYFEAFEPFIPWIATSIDALSVGFTIADYNVVMALAAAFDFASVELSEYLIAILLGVMVIPIVELVKMIQRKRAHHRK